MATYNTTTQLNISPLLASDKMSVCSETSPTSAPVVWSSEEQTLLEQNIPKLEMSEANLKSIFEIAMLFPNKSLQQLTMRLNWLPLKSKIGWEEYCRQNQKTPQNQSPKTAPSPKAKIEKTMNRRSCQFVSKKRENEEKFRKRHSVPNQTETQTLSEETKGLYTPQLGGDSMSTDSDTHITGLIKTKEVRHLKHNRGSAMFIQVPPIEESSCPVVMNQTINQNGYTQQQCQQLHQLPTLEQFNRQPPKYQLKLNLFNGGEKEEISRQITGLVMNNESILRYLESSNGQNIDSNYLNAFCLNVQNLVGLSEQLAAPMGLPFFSNQIVMNPSFHQDSANHIGKTGFGQSEL
ncbi:hypothetical protein EIN_059410 [Entamoeba invadens IP1]|uniref:hypothetical protein n=1 Tax=Entamoeba invadens IP1 TaxID=370355 RepID=UPI0002C3F8C5|nr:hypothetical protein EIN_059410 [Entamoeba invadens IP1]ELP93456.1 hypothetical protein EIN_059410 [Entamoeba invadens IP1]|eukprot:XP_004260227.1 hypothetical protein EIN_059410 [Entamoeba invadens IP1]